MCQVVKHGLANSESVGIEFSKQLISYETGTLINIRFFLAQNELQLSNRDILHAHLLLTYFIKKSLDIFPA